MEHVLSTEAMRTVNAVNSNQGRPGDTKGYVVKNADVNTELTAPANPQKRVWIIVDEDWW